MPAYREPEIIQWGIDRNILGPTGEGKRSKQLDKTKEEVKELRDALIDRDLNAIRDAIGDIYVTLVMQAHLNGITMSSCIDAAWDQIKSRRGRMVNGVFVKES